MLSRPTAAPSLPQDSERICRSAHKHVPAQRALIRQIRAWLTCPGGTKIHYRQGLVTGREVVQDSVHHLGACRDHRAQFVPVDQLCSRGSVVTGQACDLFDRHTVC